MHIKSPSSYSLVRSRLFVHVRRSIRVDVVHNAACRAWEHCRCVFNISWSETCKSQMRFAIKFGRTSATNTGDATHTTRKSKDEARERRTDSRSSVRSVFYFPLVFTREAMHVGILQAPAVLILIYGPENVNFVCCPAQSSEFSASPVNIVSMCLTQPLVLFASLVLSRNVATIFLFERIDGSHSRIDSLGGIDRKLAFSSRGRQHLIWDASACTIAM